MNHSFDAIMNEAITEGFETLSEVELLSLLTGSTEIGKVIIQQYGSLEGMCNRPLEEFLAIRGLGDVKILRIAAAFEIARRFCDA